MYQTNYHSKTMRDERYSGRNNWSNKEHESKSKTVCQAAEYPFDFSKYLNMKAVLANGDPSKK